VFFLKVGMTMFGSGYVLVSYLQSGLVDQRHWLTQQQVLDSIAVGQFTPGPLLTTATFVGFLLGYGRFRGGYVGGALGAVVATIGIFLPAFLLILLLAPVLQRVRRSPAARGALDGMNAAVIGLLSFATIRLAIPAVYDAARHRPEWLGCGILAAAVVALSAGVNSTWIILAAALLGTTGR
jgi:chromate transporter